MISTRWTSPASFSLPSVGASAPATAPESRRREVRRASRVQLKTVCAKKGGRCRGINPHEPRSRIEEAKDASERCKQMIRQMWTDKHARTSSSPSLIQSETHARAYQQSESLRKTRRAAQVPRSECCATNHKIHKSIRRDKKNPS